MKRFRVLQQVLALAGAVFATASAATSWSFVHEPLKLPTGAKVVVRQTQFDASKPEHVACKNYRLTPEEAQKKFSSYHVVTLREFRRKYVKTPCWVEGEISYKGRRYTWRSFPGNTLETNYPDGQKHLFAGVPTADGE